MKTWRFSGESGSGKTEAARIVLQFLVLVSGTDPLVKLTKDRLVQTGTLLEAFGNARTMRNDNASRFVTSSSCYVSRDYSLMLNFQGKFLDIEFDFKGDPIGGHITHCK